MQFAVRRIAAGAAMQGETGAMLCQWFLGVGPSHSRWRAATGHTWAESLRAHRFGIGAELGMCEATAGGVDRSMFLVCGPHSSAGIGENQPEGEVHEPRASNHEGRSFAVVSFA